MKILYLGDTFKHSTSAHRADALRRLGHDVIHVYPRGQLPRSRIVGGLSVRFGFWIFSPIILRAVKQAIASKKFDLAWIDAGPELGPSAYRLMRSLGMKVINYNVDDPFGPRDGRKWNLYRKSVSLQDLTVVVRMENVTEAEVVGARKVLRVYRSYDPVAHNPLMLTPEDRQKWASEVSFIGTWMPERGPFMVRLLELGVPLTIRGDWWQKAPEWDRLKVAWRGPGIYGRDYVAATQVSKVSLGLLSKGNRDLHTQRTAEVPYIAGALFCAERTSEHEKLFTHGQEAWLWGNPEECAKYCKIGLDDANGRTLMVRKAQERIIAHQLSNDIILEKILMNIESNKV